MQERTHPRQEPLTPLSEIPLEEPFVDHGRAEPRRRAIVADHAAPQKAAKPGIELEVHPGDLLKFTGLGLLALFVILGGMLFVGTFQSFLHIAPDQRSWAVMGGFLLALGGVILFGLFWGLGEVIRLLQILTAQGERRAD